MGNVGLKKEKNKPIIFVEPDIQAAASLHGGDGIFELGDRYSID